MNNSPEDKKPDNMEQLKQQASSCCSGCNCYTASTMPGMIPCIIGVIVLLAAGVLVVRAVIKSNQTQTQKPVPALTTQIGSQAATIRFKDGKNVPMPATPSETKIGVGINTFSELNFVAAKLDVLFIFVPHNDMPSENLPSAQLNDAVRTIESKTGLKCGIFTLKSGSPDYDKIVTQMSAPGVLAIVKGRGMVAVNGDISETKLVQGFVAASRSGGCGTGSSCGPASSGCK